MLSLALILNIVILVPVLSALLLDRGSIETVMGPKTSAREILTCVYGAIAVVSVGLLIALTLGAAWAVPMTFGLFAVQIVYKLATATMLGVRNPVVMTNLFVVAFQAVVIGFVVNP